jgi:hypothetical protein
MMTFPEWNNNPNLPNLQPVNEYLLDLSRLNEYEEMPQVCGTLRSEYVEPLPPLNATSPAAPVRMPPRW